jgi:uncharacterized protein with PIN domain
MTAAEPPRFIADAMLGRLAKWLRALGYDVAYERKIEDAALLARARAEGRRLLTRDAYLVRRRDLPPGTVLVRSDHLREQLAQVVAELGLSVDRYRFTRCIDCNTPLTAVARDAVRDIVPQYVFETQARFGRCPGCGRVYWPGTHWARMRERLDQLGGEP